MSQLSVSLLLLCFFFFQAEDGIRDSSVTGVQTCALPILACAGNPEDEFAYERFLDRRKQDDSDTRENLVFGAGLIANWLGLEAMKQVCEIGRASCRERV